jgi:hypothetical protein
MNIMGERRVQRYISAKDEQWWGGLPTYLAAETFSLGRGSCPGLCVGSQTISSSKLSAESR